MIKKVLLIVFFGAAIYVFFNFKEISFGILSGSMSEGRVDALEYNYDHKCFGVGTPDCSYMFDRLRVAKIQLEIDQIKSHKEEFVKKYGEKKYNDALLAGKILIKKIKHEEPSFWDRIFFGDESKYTD